MNKDKKKYFDLLISFAISLIAGFIGIAFETDIKDMIETLKEHPGYIFIAFGIIYFLFTLFRMLNRILKEYKNQTKSIEEQTGLIKDQNKNIEFFKKRFDESRKSDKEQLNLRLIRIGEELDADFRIL